MQATRGRRLTSERERMSRGSRRNRPLSTYGRKEDDSKAPSRRNRGSSEEHQLYNDEELENEVTD